MSEYGETPFYRCERNFSPEVTIHFRRSLREVFGEDLSAVLDNAPKFTSKTVKEFAEDAGIELCFPPRASPQMNPRRYRGGHVTAATGAGDAFDYRVPWFKRFDGGYLVVIENESIGLDG